MVLRNLYIIEFILVVLENLSDVYTTRLQKDESTLRRKVYNVQVTPLVNGLNSKYIIF